MVSRWAVAYDDDDDDVYDDYDDDCDDDDYDDDDEYDDDDDDDDYDDDDECVVLFVCCCCQLSAWPVGRARASGPSHAAHAGDGLEGGDTRRPLDAPGGGGTKTSGQLRHGRFGELNNVTDA